MTPQYPKDFYIQLRALNPYYRGRVTITKLQNRYHSEIAIVSSESDKIYQFIGSFYDFEDEKEALDLSTQKLSLYFKKLKTKN